MYVHEKKKKQQQHNHTLHMIDTIDRIKMTTRGKKQHYSNGERVDIIHGKYKGLSATYLCKYGKVMCSISIDGDNKDFRHVWLTSIERKGEVEDEDEHTTDAKANDNKNSQENEDGKEEKKKEVMKIMESVYDIRQKLDIILVQLHGLMND